MTAPMTPEELTLRSALDGIIKRALTWQPSEAGLSYGEITTEIKLMLDAVLVFYVPGVAQTAVTSGTLTFGALVENIAASDRNPIKRGIFIRKTSAKMAEYATKEGCHSTPLDNLRASNQGASK